MPLIGAEEFPVDSERFGFFDSQAFLDKQIQKAVDINQFDGRRVLPAGFFTGGTCECTGSEKDPTLCAALEGTPKVSYLFDCPPTVIT